MTTKTSDKSIEILDAIYHDAALTEAEQGSSSPDDKRWARDVREKVQARLAEMRRSFTPASVPVEKARPIRAALFALDRNALLAKLTELLTRMGGAVQVAHRNLTSLSDDDLRRLIDTLDPE